MECACLEILNKETKILVGYKSITIGELMSPLELCSKHIWSWCFWLLVCTRSFWLWWISPIAKIEKPTNLSFSWPIINLQAFANNLQALEFFATTCKLFKVVITYWFSSFWRRHKFVFNICLTMTKTGSIFSSNINLGTKTPKTNNHVFMWGNLSQNLNFVSFTSLQINLLRMST